MINLRTSVSVVSAKQSSGCPQNAMSTLNSSSPEFFFEVASWLRIVDIFPMKNPPNLVAISSILSWVGKLRPQYLLKDCVLFFKVVSGRDLFREVVLFGRQ
jgi:hypothetical protein